MTQIITALSEISARYDVVFCDLWGCLHNGQTVFPAAAAALRTFRAGGGTVILVTNSPRPRDGVARQMAEFGITTDDYDDIATSGDSAQSALAAGLFGRRVYHLGPEAHLGFFTDESGAPLDIERVPLEDAESVVCTGPFDDINDTPEDYRLTLMRAKQRGLKLLCANPDVQVDRGDRRIYAAGALAALYTELGGRSYYFGKPHPPIYTLSRQRAEAIRGEAVADAGILCIGDGLTTDIEGGLREGLDTLFVTGGLAAAETGTTADAGPDPEKLHALLHARRISVTAAIGMLR